MRKLLLASVAVGAISFSWSAGATPLNIGVDLNPLGPEFIITFSTSGVSTALNPAYAGVSPGPYDGVEDTYFGVINNSSSPISIIPLKSTLDIGGFDGDGIVALSGGALTGNAMDTTGYGGPNAFFTNNLGTSLDVNFITPIPTGGGTDVFSLEEAVSLNNIIVGVPEVSTWAMMMLGFAGLGYAGYRKSRPGKVAMMA